MRKYKAIFSVLFLLLTLCACQAEPASQTPSMPEPDPVVFIRTSVQVQPDKSYAIWEYAADNSRIRLTTYDMLGTFQYRIDYHYDQQGRVSVEQTIGLNEDGSTRTHTRTYDYSGVDVVVAVSDFSYEGASCGFTMTDPNHHVNIEHIGITDGKVAEMTIEELDEEGVWVTEERIVLDK